MPPLVQIGHQVVVPNDFALLLPVVLADYALTAKGHPLHKPVLGLSDIRHGADGPPQLLIVHEAEQKDRPHHAAQGEEGQV